MERVLPRTLTFNTGQAPLRRVLQLVRTWRMRVRTRRQLAQLDDHQLNDVGISHSERLEELSKPFWR